MTNKKIIVFVITATALVFLFLAPWCFGGWDNTLPADNSTWNNAAGEIRANWDAMEVIWGVDLVDAGRVLAVFNVQDSAYGATGDGSTDDTTLIQAAIDAAELVGGIVYFPEPTSFYKLTDRLLIDSANVKVMGSGMGCEIRQTTWGKPVFEVRADDVWIDGLYLNSNETKTAITQATVDNLANNARAYCAGIYVAAADRYRFTNLRIDGFVAGIRPRGEVDNASLSEGGFIENVWISTIDQGILPRQQRGMIINNIWVSDIAVSQTGDPTHAIYFVGQSTVLSADCITTNVTTWDNTGGHAFQVKFSERCIFDNLNVYVHPGLLILVEEVTDCIFTNLTGLGMTDTGGTNAKIHISGTTNRRNRISGVNLDNSTPGNVFLSILNASGTNDDNIIENALLTDSCASDATECLVLRGVRNIMRDIRINNTDIARKGISIGTSVGTATGCILDGITATNAAGSFFFTIGTSTSSQILYDSDLIDLQSGNLTSDSGTTTIIRDSHVTLTVASVDLTASEIKALAATQIELVAAPGTGLYLEFISAVLILDKGGTAYDDASGDGNMVIKFVDGSGAAVSQDIEGDGFIDAAADTITNALPKIDAIVAASACVNKALVLDNDGNEYTTGDGVIRVKITTRTHSILGL